MIELLINQVVDLFLQNCSAKLILKSLPVCTPCESLLCETPYEEETWESNVTQPRNRKLNCISVYLCHVCLPPLVSIESIFSPSRLVTWQEEDVNNVVVGGGRERERETVNKEDVKR